MNNKLPPSTIVQISTFQALKSGIYDGDTTFKQLQEFGDFGLATLNGLDGVVVAFDGQFYQVKGNGSVCLVPDNAKTPIASVHFFNADMVVKPEIPFQNYQLFQNYLNQLLPDRNRPYAFKIKGKFNYLKMRSSYKQSKPYLPIAKIIEKQPIFELNDVTGTAVGYWCPYYLVSIRKRNSLICFYYFIEKQDYFMVNYK
jgi:acetolactate decarboxylase